MLKVKEITYKIRGKEIISDINFSLKTGELLCLLGPNGAGKTTIVKCLNNLYQPDNGDIFIDQDNISELSRKEIASRVAYIPQEQETVFSYNVLEFTVMGFTPYFGWWKSPGSKEYDKAAVKLEELGIGHLADRSFNTLSGGEKQLVLLARTLLQNTDYLILDEPTSHLDFKNIHFLLNKLESLAKNNNKGIVITLHNPNLARNFSDQTILIKKGKIIKKGKSNQVVTPRYLEKAYEVSINSGNTKTFHPEYEA